MFITVLAILIMLASAALVVQQMRGVAEDTVALLRTELTQSRRAGRLASNTAFGLLFALIFVLSYV